MRNKIIITLATLLALWSVPSEASYRFNPYTNKQDYYQGEAELHPIFSPFDHQHPVYGPEDLSGLLEHTHPQYLPTTYVNQHDEAYADIDHQHPIYVPFTDLTKQHIVTVANAEFVTTHVSGVPMPGIFTQSKHYTGFETHLASTLSFNNNTQTFTLTTSNQPIWINGKRFFFNTDSVTIPDTTGLYWFYIDLVNGVPDLLYSASAPGFEKCLVATVYWETTNNLSIVGNEQHWFGRDKWMHEYLHQTIGARYSNGLTGTFTNTTLSITQGEIYDEDLEHNTGGTLTNADVFYKDGAATFEFDENQTAPYKAIAGTLQYNNGNTLTPVPVSSYVANWVYATNSTTRPIQVIAGQRVDATIANARTNNTPDTLSLGTLPSAEMKLLYRVIYRNVAGTATYIETADYRNVTPVPNGAFTPTDHSALSNLTWSTANHVINTDTDWGGYSLQDLGGPVNPTDAATKAYVDSNQHPVYATNIQNLTDLVLVNAHPEYLSASGGNYSIAFTNTHPNYDTAFNLYSVHSHPEYGGNYSAYFTHQHPQYLSSSYTNQHDTYYANKNHLHPEYGPVSVAGLLAHQHTQYLASSYSHTHAEATASAAGFVEALSGVATQYYNGAGSWSTPAGGGGGGGIVIGSVPFERLSSPQALQGIEQLRHIASSYQMYGEVVVDGLQDQTGTQGPAYNMAYTSGSGYSAADSVDSYVKLLIHLDGADGQTSYTAETGQTVTFTNAQLDTAQQKFGVSSLLCDGSGDRITVPDSADWQYADGDFTIEMWVRFNSIGAAQQSLYHQNSDASNLCQFKWDGSAMYFAVISGGATLIDLSSTGYTPPTNQWIHFSVVRYGNVWTMYANGQPLDAETDVQTFPNYSSAIIFGYQTVGATCDLDGWIDEIRISKGIARYTGAFTPRTVAFGSALESGYMHTRLFPFPSIMETWSGSPTHAGVVVKLDESFAVNNQHQNIRVQVSRDGTNWADCHPIIPVGNHKYYRASMADLSSSIPQHRMCIKIGLSGATTRRIEGYGIYGE